MYTFPWTQHVWKAYTLYIYASNSANFQYTIRDQLSGLDKIDELIN